MDLDKVPAKHEGWMGWMLEVWEEHREVGREVVVWCSGSQAAELSSVAHKRLVTVALVADGMVEVETEWRQWRVISAPGSRGGCQHVWRSGPGGTECVVGWLSVVVFWSASSWVCPQWGT